MAHLVKQELTSNDIFVPCHFDQLSAIEKKYRDDLSRLPNCQACGGPGTYHEDTGEWLLDPAHVKSRGAGGLVEANLIALCRKCHVEQHKKGIVRFEEKYGIDMESIAKRNWELWPKPGKTLSEK